MNKLFLIGSLFLSVPTLMQASLETKATHEPKQQKIEQLFELTNDQNLITSACEPLFVNANITDARAKKTAIDKYLRDLKQNFITTHDKLFTETDIENMLEYNRVSNKFIQSATGQKIMASHVELNAIMSKAYDNMMTSIYELTAAQEKATNATKAAKTTKQELAQPAVSVVKSDVIKTTNVICFDEKAQGKNNTAVRELFKQEINHDGLVVVKFSSPGCGPCKMYAPIFKEVAKELKQTLINDKKMAIKYLTIDTDAVAVIAEDCSIKSLPTTIFYKNGTRVHTQVGLIKKEDLITRIQELVA